MLVPAPLLDADCLAKILRGHGLELIEFGPFLVLVRGDASKWPILKHTTFGKTEVQDVFDVAGLDFLRLEEYRTRFCGAPADQSPRSDAVLN
jgi:hypothetical protein